MKKKRVNFIFLLLTFCFANVTFGGLAFSNSIVYLHKNHVHFYTCDKSNELSETDKEDSDSITSFDLIALKSTGFKNRALSFTHFSDLLSLPHDSFNVSEKINRHTFHVVITNDKPHCNTNLFLQNSSYII